MVVGALGTRNATQELCGTWEAIEHPSKDGGPTIVDDIDGAGLFGRETSRSSRYPPHAQFEYVGHVVRDGKKVCMKQFTPSDEGRYYCQSRMLLSPTHHF
jgi:hypothetical protein